MERDSIITELKDKQLDAVSDGSDRERTLTVSIYLTQYQFNGDVSVNVYVDGEIRTDLSKTVNPLVELFNIQIKGAGMKA